jgi:uncharacterized protein (DUF2062 family)
MKLRERLVGFLRQGISPRKLAFTIALGIALGITPVLGSTTILCALAALLFRLNLPAIQMVNGFVYPLQLALLIPFLRAGAWIFGASQTPVSLQQVTALVRANALHAIAALWVATVHALAVWLVCGAVGTGLLYLALVPVVQRLWRSSL